MINKQYTFLQKLRQPLWNSTCRYIGGSHAQKSQQIGSFEQSFQIPPRYFLVTYKLNDNFIDNKEKYEEEHNKAVKKLLGEQKILIKGYSKDKNEIFFVYHGKDERIPHDFIMGDQYYINGLVKNWDIKEMDLIHAERDDELVVSAKYR